MAQEAGHGSLIDKFLSNDAEENGDEEMYFEEPDMEANENEGEANDNENEEWGLDESWECEEDQDMEGDADDMVNQGIKNAFAEFQMSDDAEADDGVYESVEDTVEEAGQWEETGNEHLQEAPRTPDEDEEAAAVEPIKATRELLYIGREIEVKRTDGTWSVGKVSECLDGGALVMMQGAKHGQTKMIKWGSQSVWRFCSDSIAPSDQDEHAMSAGEQAEAEEQEGETDPGLSVFEVAEEELKQEDEQDQEELAQDQEGQEQETPAPEQEQEQEEEAPAADQSSTPGVKKPVAKIRPVAKFRVKAHPPPPDPPPPPSQVQPPNQVQMPTPGQFMQAAAAALQNLVPGFRPPPVGAFGRPPPPHIQNHIQQTPPPPHMVTQSTIAQPQVQSPPPAQPPPAVRPPPQHVRGPHVRGPAPVPAQVPQIRAPVSKANHFTNAAASVGLTRPVQPIGASARMPIGAPFPKGGASRDLSVPQVQKAPFPKGGLAASGASSPPQPPVPVHPRPAIPKDASVVGTTLDLKSELKSFAAKRNLSDEWVEKVSAWEPQKIRNLLTSRESDDVTKASASQETRKPPKQPPVPPPKALRETGASVAPNLSQPSLEPVQKAPRPKWRPTAPEPPWKPPPQQLLDEKATPGGGSNESTETSDVEQEASRRLAQSTLTQKEKEMVERLKENTGLNDDATIGLRFLTKEQFRKLWFQDELEKKLLAVPLANNVRRELAIKLIGGYDASVESFVRKLWKVDGLQDVRPVEPQVAKGSGKTAQPQSGKGQVVPPPGRKGGAADTQTASIAEKGKPPEVPKTTEERNLMLIFSHTCLPKIVGRNGSTLNKIREDSGVEVKVSNKLVGKGGEKICEVLIRGSAHGVEAARKGVTEQAGEEPRQDQRLIAGEKGKGKEESLASSGKGKGKEETPASVGKGKGKEEASASGGKSKGKEEALTSADKAKGKEGKGKAAGKPIGKPIGKPAEETLPAGDKGKGKAAGKPPVASPKKDAPEKEIHIQVGDQYLQAILGKSGIVLKEIRSKSGASVVLKRGDKSFDIKISGTKEQAEAAEKMINDLINRASKAQAANSQQSAASSSSSAPHVGASVDRANSDELARAKPSKGGAKDSGAVVKARSRSPRRNTSTDSTADPRKEWLHSLDENGDMLRYLDPLRKNFSSLSQLTHVLVDTPGNGKTVLSCIEPDFFDVLQVESLGHRLILAKAIVALSSKKT